MSERGPGGDRLRELEDAYAGYTVYDEHYERIGRVDDLFVDGEGREHYIGVKMGTFRARSTLIPMELVRVNDLRGLVEVAAPREVIERAPSFDDDAEISGDLERRIRAYFGDARPETFPNAQDYFPAHPHEGPVDTEFGERADLPLHPPEGAVPAEPPPGEEPFPAPAPEEHHEGEPPPPESPAEGDRVRVRRLQR